MLEPMRRGRNNNPKHQPKTGDIRKHKNNKYHELRNERNLAIKANELSRQTGCALAAQSVITINNSDLVKFA